MLEEMLLSALYMYKARNQQQQRTADSKQPYASPG